MPKFSRTTYADSLPVAIFDQIVEETKKFLDRRFETLAVDFNDISDSNFNPFLLLITSPVYNLFSPFEIAERLQLGRAFHGDDTAFGKFGEDKLLPLFGAKTPPEKGKLASWEPIDREITVEGTRYLMSIKSGPWTMNQAHANAMIDKFPDIHTGTNATVIIGILYGRYENLNNKPKLVGDSIGNPAWFDYLVGKDFWEFISGVRDVHKEIFRAIREAQRQFRELHSDETFYEKLVANRLKIAASLRREFKVAEEEDFWETLFNNMF